MNGIKLDETLEVSYLVLQACMVFQTRVAHFCFSHGITESNSSAVKVNRYLVNRNSLIRIPYLRIRIRIRHLRLEMPQIP